MVALSGEENEGSIVDVKVWVGLGYYPKKIVKIISKKYIQTPFPYINIIQIAFLLHC